MEGRAEKQRRREGEWERRSGGKREREWSRWRRKDRGLIEDKAKQQRDERNRYE